MPARAETDRLEGALPAHLRSQYALYADWCAGMGVPAIPATRDTLIGFLRANPAAAQTQRKRLAAVRAAHARAAAAIPAKTTTSASVMSPPLPWADNPAAAVVAALPTVGWPSGLFGRRDALLIVLSEAMGISYRQMERLQRSDARVIDAALQIKVGGIWISAAPEDDPRYCPAAVFLRWARLLAFMDKWLINDALEEALIKARPLTDTSVESYAPLPPIRDDGPLLLPIDRWGGLGMGSLQHAGQPRGLRATTIAEILTARLDGTGSRRRRRWDDEPDWNVDDDPMVDSVPEPELGEWDVRSGLRARADAQTLLSGVGDALDEVEREADELAARIAAVLNGEYPVLNGSAAGDA
ncbi:hypothetical protein [Rhodococcus pyridinivorans]|jgi:hypothetical protein|uniref:hypothetical protein n=1 Tax=Rhodococcus pyridinivorans TaxID=103816 RepID=UPI00110F51A2|nr:hypothetical protein [Rhodococcus pyridinivorans]WAL49692.1 hypothetical protein OQN32_27150 [Rhodococcus pyridinivorans]